MKLYHTSNSSVLAIYFPLMAVFILLCFTATTQYANLHRAHWVFLILLIALLISPARSLRFGQRTCASPKWFFTITGLISLLILFFYLGTAFFCQQLPIDQPADFVPLSSAFLLTQGGLCPWAVVALFAITLQKVCLKDHQPGLISSCLRNIFHTNEHEDVGKFINIYIRHVMLFALIMPIILSWFAVLHLVTSYYRIQLPLGINVVTMAVTTYIFWIMSYTRWVRGLNWLLDHRVPKLGGVMIMTASMVILLAGFTILGVHATAFLNLPFKNYHFFNPDVLPLLWKSFNTFLVFGWVPIASAVIATVSRGYPVWQIILATMLVPVISLFIIPAHPSTSLALNDIVLILLCLALLLIFYREKYLTNFLRGILPFPEEVKPRNTAMLSRTLLISSVTLLCIYWVLGIYGLYFILAIATTPALILIMLSILVNFKSLLVGSYGKNTHHTTR